MSHRPAERDRLAAAFGHPGVADAYQYRPPYPPEAFDILERIKLGVANRTQAGLIAHDAGIVAP